jgi:hypothetical protein
MVMIINDDDSLYRILLLVKIWFFQQYIQIENLIFIFT